MLHKHNGGSIIYGLYKKTMNETSNIQPEWSLTCYCEHSELKVNCTNPKVEILNIS